MQCLLTPGRAFQAGTSRFVKWQWWLQTMTIKSMITASSIRTWHCGSFLQEHVKLFLSPSEKVPLKTAPIPLQKNGNNHPRYVEGPFSQESSVSDPLCVHHLYSRSDCSSLALLKEIQHWTGTWESKSHREQWKAQEALKLGHPCLKSASHCLPMLEAVSSSQQLRSPADFLHLFLRLLSAQQLDSQMAFSMWALNESSISLFCPLWFEHPANFPCSSGGYKQSFCC